MGDSTVRCPRCKTTVAAERARGLRGICPRCLFEALIAPDDEAARSPLELLEGTELGNYTVLGLVGSGGMGVVYRARQKGLDRVVALKILNPRGTAGREEVERFFREARAAARLQHPNIVAIHEVGSASGYYFFTMDYVEGRTLHDFIEDHPLDARTAATVLAKVARAVHYAHEQGIIHRDLKPANILVDRDGEPRVMDFGLAKEIASESRLTQSGVVMGTPSYMSPEQARGEPLDGRTDVYSLGAVLYEALTGLPPFRGRDPATVLRQVLEVEPMPPRRLRADTPRDLETICLKALEKERERRYATAAELADDLERFLRGEAVRARRAGPVYRARRWIARHAAVAALALLAFGFAGAFVWTATRPRVGSMANGPSTTPPSVPSDEGILAVRRAVDAARRKIEAAEAMTAEDALARRVAFLQEALARLDEVAANGRACADWAYWRGRALLALHRHEEAVTEFTRAVLADPHHTDARYGRLRAHMELIALGAMVQQLPNAYRVRAVRADRDALRDAGAPADIVATADASVAALDAIGAILPARDDRRLDEAVARLRRHADEARAQNPTNPLAPFLEAFVAVLASPDDRSGLETLLALVDAALDRHPGDVFYLSARAWTLARLGRPADATAAADRLEAIAPESTLAPLCRAWICAGSGDVFGAEKALRQARGRQTHIEFIAPMDLAPLAPAGGADLAGEGFAGMDDEGLVGGPATDWRSLEQNVIASARIGDMASALDGLAQLASGGWNNWYVLESDPKAEAFALLPEYCEIKSWFALNPQEAAARVRHALDVAGKALAAAESLRTADDIARRDSFLTQALSSLDEAVRTDSSVAEIHYLRGRALRLLQRRGEATDALTRAILADPNHARARYLRAMVTAEELMDTSDVLGEPDPAALARLREDADWLEAHGAPADHVLVARGFERLAATLPAMLVPVDRPGHPEVPADEIRECAQRALEENPTNPHAYVVAAYAEWGREGHELSRPIEMLRRALEYAPTDVWIAQRLGRVLVASGSCAPNDPDVAGNVRRTPDSGNGACAVRSARGGGRAVCSRAPAFGPSGVRGVRARAGGQRADRFAGGVGGLAERSGTAGRICAGDERRDRSRSLAGSCVLAPR
jgi:tetratricopeptide (TPR) repeat protein